MDRTGLIRRLGLATVFGVNLTLASCSSSASIPPPSFRGPTIAASVSEACQTFTEEAGPLQHSESQLASLDSRIASLATSTGDPSLRRLGEELQKQLHGVHDKLQHPSSDSFDALMPAQKPLREIGSICIAKGFTPKYIYEEL